MAQFKYTARDMEGKKISGKIDANNRNELASLLRSKNEYLIDCKDVTSTAVNSYKMKLKELSDFSRQLGTMIGSGVSLIRAMSILVQRENNKKIKAIYMDIYRKLQQGLTLSMAMEAQGKAFPLLMINMYRTGETSGQMEKVAMTMALQYEKDNRIRGKVKNAMIYPVILLCVTMFVIIAVFTWIIPQFSEAFKGAEPPMITRIVNSISDVFLQYWYWLIIGVLSLVAIFTGLLRVDSIRYKFDRFKLRSPLFGKLLCVIYTSRFARNMCSLYTSGITIINALTIIKDNIGNAYIESQFETAVKSVRNGTTLSQSISKFDGFDSKLASSIYIGEESGKLEDMLTSLADEFDFEAEAATQKMVTIMEPIMIIVLAIIVLFVMMAVLLPIYQMYQDPSTLTA